MSRNTIDKDDLVKLLQRLMVILPLLHPMTLLVVQIQMVHLIETVRLGELNFLSNRMVHLTEMFLRKSQWYT